VGGSFEAVGRQAERAMRWLPILYLAWALPLVFVVACVTPPFQNPDEGNHMLRAVQVERGGLTGFRHVSPTPPERLSAGGYSDAAISVAEAPFVKLPAHRAVKATQDEFARSGNVPFGPSTLSWFPNTALYPPFFYLPAALGIGVAQIAGLHVLDGLYAARFADGVVAVLLTFLALVVARRARPALAVLAMLPMTVALYAALTQDALLIPAVFLAVGLADRIVAEDRAASRRELVAIAILIGLVATARPPYVALAFMLPALAKGEARRGWIACSAVVAVAVLWFVYIAVFVLVDNASGKPGAQVQYLLAHPGSMIAIASDTLRIMLILIGHEMIGNLGWLDTPLPRWFWDVAGIALLGGFAGATAGPARRAWAFVLIPLVACGAIIAASYIQWSAPGAHFAYGLQGRYFTPILAVVALALPSLPAAVRPAVASVATIAIGILWLLGPATMLWTLVARFYLNP